jgi:hypothetical protein
MATILTKKSDTSSAVPASGDLTNSTGGAELAVNTADKRLFTKNSGGTVVEVGTNPSTLTTATLSVTGNTTLGDAFGDSVTINAGTTTFAATGARITGDFSNATIANRPAFQSSSTNASTVIHAYPSGTGPTSGFEANNNSDPTNSSALQMFAGSGDASVRSSIRGTGTYLPMTFYTGGSERMRIDTSGNVGIGTSSPQGPLEVVGVSWFTRNSKSTSLNPDYGSAGTHALITTPTSMALAFATSGDNERMRIDSSGNLLVGKTASAIGTAGFETSASGNTLATRSNGVVMSLNRLSTDGTILDIRKDSTTVGTIGTKNLGSGISNLFVGATDTGFSFQGHTNNAITPINAEDQTNRDDVISLGASGSRFKDLYLSGGVYVGGTTSANYLDDYEEGTFTVTTNSDPTGSFSAQRGEYTKIGDFVFCRVALVVGTNFTNYRFGGFPFTMGGDGTVSGLVGSTLLLGAGGASRCASGSTGSTYINIFTDATVASNFSPTSGQTIRFSFAYKTS